MFQCISQSGGRSSHDNCVDIGFYLRKMARSWYKQLNPEIQYTWKSLLKAFQIEFCAHRDSPTERYNSLHQKSDESPRQNLWRLTAAAKKAEVKYGGGSVKDHILRFIGTLNV